VFVSQKIAAKIRLVVICSYGNVKNDHDEVPAGI